MKNPVSRYDAIIVGAGFSGLYQLHLLRDKLNLRCLLIEAGDGVGGTWYWNRYPGARCDSPSHSYSYYFSEDLIKKWTWTERYPGQPEIESYLNFVADELDLKTDICFGKTVNQCKYMQDQNCWHVTTIDGSEFQTKYLIAAVGCLSMSNKPVIKGIETFTGSIFHTGNWPKEDINFFGKTVAVIGTGASAIQAIPLIAEQAKKLTVFQRTPNYSVPACNHKLSEATSKKYKKEWRSTLEIMQTSRNGLPWLEGDKSLDEIDEPTRTELLEDAWEKGGLGFREAFKGTLRNRKSNSIMSKFVKNKIIEKVDNPEVAKLLTDFDHPFASKRPPLDTNYFETFNKKNVSLVNLNEQPIKNATPNGLETKSETFNLDVLVLATGFDAMTGAIEKLGVTGRSGTSINDFWQDGPKTYLGVHVPHFPNFFVLAGPGSPSVLTNMPRSIEFNVEWVGDCIEYLENNGFSYIEADLSASNKWSKDNQKLANETLFVDAEHSWYLGANIPGKPRLFYPYAGGFPRYKAACNEAKSQDYDGLIVG